MNHVGLLLSYFHELEAAQNALRTLGQKGFRRRSLLQKTPDGRVSIHDPNIHKRIFLTLIIGSCTSVAGVGISFAGTLPQILSQATLNHLLNGFPPDPHFFLNGQGSNIGTSCLYFVNASGLFFIICLSFIGIEAKRNIASIPIAPAPVYHGAP